MQTVTIQAASLPPQGDTKEAFSFIITALRYADDTYAEAARRPSAQPSLDKTGN